MRSFTTTILLCYSVVSTSLLANPASGTVRHLAADKVLPLAVKFNVASRRIQAILDAGDQLHQSLQRSQEIAHNLRQGLEQQMIKELLGLHTELERRLVDQEIDIDTFLSKLHYPMLSYHREAETILREELEEIETSLDMGIGDIEKKASIGGLKINGVALMSIDDLIYKKNKDFDNYFAALYTVHDEKKNNVLTLQDEISYLHRQLGDLDAGTLDEKLTAFLTSTMKSVYPNPKDKHSTRDEFIADTRMKIERSIGHEDSELLKHLEGSTAWDDYDAGKIRDAVTARFMTTNEALKNTLQSRLKSLEKEMDSHLTPQ